MARAQDPFYILRAEIQDSVNGLQQKVSRFHGLTVMNPERKMIAANVEKGCKSLASELNELDTAVERASGNPQRFNLTPEELSSRRRWLDDTRRQVEGVKAALRTATAPPLPESRAVAQNQSFIKDQYQQQELMLRRQDDDIDDIEAAVMRIGRQGQEIGNELEDQRRLLDELDGDMDSTTSRLRVAQKKMQEIIRKSGSNTQLVLIVTLVAIVVVLSFFVFM